MRKIIAIALLCILPLSAGAMEKRDTIDVSIDELLMTDAYLDTVNVKKKFILNDYTMIGVQYGVGINQMSFNPSKRQSHLITPRHFGIVLTTYGKIFGYMPYFGLETGVFYGQDGYKFKPDPEDGTYPYNVDHAVECVYDYVEVPFMSQFHIDQEHFKVMISAGMYGGWRYKVHRTWEEGYDYVNYTDNFYDHDIKLDYGLKFGAGFGLVFSPVEIHLKGQLRYGFGNIYKRDYFSPDHYRYAKPLDIEISLGAHFHLGKRTGKTRKVLKQEAYDMVYNPENTENSK